jgi:hypothetical protein
MRPRSVRTSPSSSAKKSRADYGEGSPAQPAKKKSEQPVRKTAEENQRVSNTSTGKIYREKIAERAHSIWEREGCPDGRNDEFWFRAEAELKNEISAKLKS